MKLGQECLNTLGPTLPAMLEGSLLGDHGGVMSEWQELQGSVMDSQHRVGKLVSLTKRQAIYCHQNGMV